MGHKICVICARDDDCDHRNDCQKRPSLNVGSGLMLKKECINLDVKSHSHRGRSTDVIGDINNVDKIFEEGQFDSVLAFHVLEHFRKGQMQEILGKLRYVLRVGGKLIVETPDLIGMYKLYWERHKDIVKLEAAIYGGEAQIYGEAGWHRSGWTQETMAEEMEKAGFEIVHKGIGISHGMGMRDLRVEGVKK